MDETMRSHDHATNLPQIDINHVVQLIQTLYHSANPDDQHEANRRLTELQSSEEVWQICWPLLDPDRAQPAEVHFFAANSLVLKINQTWSQQDEDWLEHNLRPKLFETLVKYASSPKGARLVIERLSLALATFALHSIPTFWPDAIENILQTFTSDNLPVNISHQRICDILLKVLIYIPEEYSVMLPQQDHRAKLNGQMTQVGPIVFKFLYSLLIADESVTSPECRQNVLKCLTSWTLHSSTSLLELDNGKSFLDMVHDMIVDEELCSYACSTLAASFSGQKAENFRNAIIEFIPKIASLGGVIEKYINEDEMDCAIKVYSLVINFSENHSRLFLRILLNDGAQLEGEKQEIAKQSIFSIIKIILNCTSAPGIFGLDEKYSEMTFPFWFSFFECFYYYSEAYYDLICDYFDPLVDSLMQILITKSQYPPTATYQQVWNDDQREAFRCYRQDLGDNLSLIIHFPRARDRILAQLHAQMSHELDVLLQCPPNIEEKPWQRLEANIFALKSIAEAINFDELEYMPKIFDLLSRIPFTATQAELYCTVAEMISAYSDWLYSQSGHLATAFTILFLGVTSPNSHVRLMSTLSLKDITLECQAVLQPYAPQIVRSCTETLLQKSFALDTNEKSRLMHTIGATLPMTAPEELAISLSNLTMPLICDLNVKSHSDPSIDPTCRPIILDRLTMLSSLIESLYVKSYTPAVYEEGDENSALPLDFNRCDSLALQQRDSNIQPAISLIKQLVPIMTVISEKYSSDEEIMDKISNTIKKATKSLSTELKPVVKDLLAIVVISYDPLMNSSILEGVVPIYMVFKVDKTLREFFRDAFARISDKTLNVCLGNPLRQLSSTVENYFRFAATVCKKFPDFLTEQPTPLNIEYVYKLAIACLELPEKRTLAEVCGFLSLFRQKSIGIEFIHNIFVSQLNLLLTNIFSIYGGVFNTPRNALEHVTDLLYLITDANEAKVHLNLIVERDNFPSIHVSRDQKARFVSRILQEKNRNKYKIACSEFVLTVRNLNRSL